jgi:phosphatidylserine decarboxylase
MWLLCGLLIWLFREPRHAVTVHPLGVVSPLHGRVTTAHSAHDPYLDREAVDLQQVSGWSGPFLVCSPIEGRLVKQWDGWLEAGQKCRGLAVCIQTDEGDAVVLALRGRLPWAVSTRVQVGERVGHGRPFGVMPLGGHGRVLLGGHARVVAPVGTRVVAGESLIGELLHD